MWALLALKKHIILGTLSTLSMLSGDKFDKDHYCLTKAHIALVANNEKDFNTYFYSKLALIYSNKIARTTLLHTVGTLPNTSTSISKKIIQESLCNRMAPTTATQGRPLDLIIEHGNINLLNQLVKNNALIKINYKGYYSNPGEFNIIRCTPLARAYDLLEDIQKHTLEGQSRLVLKQRELKKIIYILRKKGAKDYTWDKSGSIEEKERSHLLKCDIHPEAEQKRKLLLEEIKQCETNPNQNNYKVLGIYRKRLLRYRAPLPPGTSIIYSTTQNCMQSHSTLLEEMKTSSFNSDELLIPLTQPEIDCISGKSSRGPIRKEVAWAIDNNYHH
jgi:hypothetical protein